MGQQIPILNGIFVSNIAKLRTSYPRNLIPTPKDNGVSKGYLRPAEGITRFDDGNAIPGIDRGGINWNGVAYRVMGNQLCQIGINGAVTQLGNVGFDNNYVSFTYSFDRLAIASAGNLFYYFNNALSQVVDPDLGVCLDVIWVDSYFMSTDGTNIVVTDLADPYSVNPLKYGSAETNPDAIIAMLKLRDEPQAVGRYTIEALQDIGGTLFPFQRIDGATINRGAVGRKTCCVFPVGQADQVAFLGSGFNEPCAVWLGSNGISAKISTAEIDEIILGYTEAALATAVVETRLIESHAFLYVHLTNQTLVYDYNASQAVEQPIWYTLDSGLGDIATYQARCFTWCFNKWIFGDPTQARLGTFTETISSHYGQDIGWQFGTLMIYNEGNSGIIHELELIALTGDIANGINPSISTRYSSDGITYSVENFISAGKIGETNKRLVWLGQGPIRKFRIQQFKGNSKAHISMLSLQPRIEGLANGL